MWLGNAVMSSTLLADPPSKETIDVFYIKKRRKKKKEKEKRKKKKKKEKRKEKKPNFVVCPFQLPLVGSWTWCKRLKRHPHVAMNYFHSRVKGLSVTFTQTVRSKIGGRHIAGNRIWSVFFLRVCTNRTAPNDAVLSAQEENMCNFLGTLAKLRGEGGNDYYLPSCLSVCPYARMEQFDFHWNGF